MSAYPLIAVDIGNARIKLGLFQSTSGTALPEPKATLQLTGGAPEFERLDLWLRDVGLGSSITAVGPEVSDRPPSEPSPSEPHAEVQVLVASFVPHTRLAWHIASVNRPATTRLIDWLRANRPDDEVRLLAASDLPLTVELKRPDMVGVDRLLDAVAANCLRTPGRPAVVVDVGTAITVDLLSAKGAFRGGAILPGIAMSARALHEFTDLLPLIDMVELAAPPPPVGTATHTAMRSGLYWGTVGAIRQLVEQMTGSVECEVFLTGGAGPAVAALLGPNGHHVPHLTLAGIAVAAVGWDKRSAVPPGG
jgi:type III pantothenate kinase